MIINKLSFYFQLFHFRRFNLIESKETDVLRDLELALRLSDDPTNPNSPANANTANTNVSGTTAQVVVATGASSPALPTGTNSSETNMLGIGSCDTTNITSNESTMIDGDTTIQPICTQPESSTLMVASGVLRAGDQSDLRGGAGGGPMSLPGCFINKNGTPTTATTH